MAMSITSARWVIVLARIIANSAPPATPTAEHAFDSGVEVLAHTDVDETDALVLLSLVGV